MQRVLVYDHADTPLFELSPLEVLGLVRKEVINGEHSLTIKTTRVLEKGQRVLTKDKRGKWREHVVYGTDESHANGSAPTGTYYCVWSLMHDLMGTTVSRMVGTQTPVGAGVALEAALSGTSRWSVGTVTNPNVGGASMYDMGGWKAMGVMTKVWGGEIDASIEVDGEGVVDRAVDYYDTQGEHEAKRRFDFGADLKSVRRKIPDGPMYCRISPRGKGEQTESGGYGRKITIESVNDGKDWLENADVVQLTRLPDGNGGWEYPTIIVENGQIETPAELMEWGLSVLDDYTVPKVSYSVDVVQASREGVDLQGVSLGDVVQVVDGKFDGLRLSARVVSIETDMLDEMAVKVTLGNVGENITTSFAKLQGDIATVSAAIEAVRSGTEMTDSYLRRLVDRLNEEINADGGYWYIVEGIGSRTYDTQVSDPAIGAEANKVIEMRGGALRIADSRDAQGNWEWKTVFVSGHVASQLVTAAELVTGFIGNANSGSYWNLDTGQLRIAPNSMFGDRSAQDIIDGYDATITDIIYEFAVNTDQDTPPSSGWSTDLPQREQGQYIWQRNGTVTADGTEYSTPILISGRDGRDGTSVTILGSYNTVAELQAAHPTGTVGDSYIVAGDLYVWNGAAWEDVGQIQGPAGTSVTVTSIQYGVSNSASTQPSWSTTVPTSIAQGKWLWVKTNYSNNSSSITKSYTGTDGQNGKSVYVQSSTKVGDTTTIELTDGTTVTTITIKDGEDGADGVQGPAGEDGSNSYVHFAWANTPDGSGTSFSTDDSSGKSYMGVYADSNTADSQDHTKYSWSKIEGEAGQNGVAITSMVQQWYLSTLSQELAGGSWDYRPQPYVQGRYYWERYEVQWSDNRPATYTSAVPSRGINAANKAAEDAAKVATNYLTFDSSVGLDISYAGTDAKTRISGSGMEVFDGNGDSALLVGLSSGNSMVRIGKPSGMGNILLSSDGNVDIRRGSIVVAHFGYGNATNPSGVVSLYPYYDLGTRKSGSTVGGYSIVEGAGSNVASAFASHACGLENTASGYYSFVQGQGNTASGGESHAEGMRNTASGLGSHAEGEKTTASGSYSHAEGCQTKASGTNSHAEGWLTEAKGNYSHAGGRGTIAAGISQFVVGDYNVERTGLPVIVGGGSSSTRKNALTLTNGGSMWIAGSLTQNSDRRLKEHHAYLGEDACEFVRKLRPALYTKDGERQVGFYAQDVQEADPWDTATVKAEHSDESLDFDPLTLDYNALIAPLVAYTQQLEKRVESLERRIDELEAK